MLQRSKGKTRNNYQVRAFPDPKLSMLSFCSEGPGCASPPAEGTTLIEHVAPDKETFLTHFTALSGGIYFFFKSTILKF